MHRWIVLFSACTLLVVASCTKRFKVDQAYFQQPSSWPYHRGDLQAHGSWSDSASFNGKLDILWEDKYGHKPSAPLTMYHGSLVVPTTGKRIRFYDAESGHEMGEIKLKGIGQTSVLVDDSLLFVALAPTRNRLEAISLESRKVRWRQPIKDAASAPIIVNDRLIISSSDGYLKAIDPKTGNHLWQYTGEGRFTAPISYGDGRIFQPADNGYLYVIAANSGRLLYRVKLTGPIASAAVVTDIVYVGTTDGELFGLRASDGSVLWHKQVGGPIWGAPAVSEDLLVVGHSAGEVQALNRYDGSPVWKFPTVEVIKASPLIVGQYVIVGSMGGKLWVLNRDDGTVVSQGDVTGAIAFPPVTDGERVYVATQSGRIISYGERHEPLSEDRQRSDAAH